MAGRAMTDLRLAAAKGLSDPTVRLGVGCKPLCNRSIAFSVSFPFRILDHNQGGRRDTQLDIDRKARLRKAGRAHILGDVDCAYAGVDRAAARFRPYRDEYPQQASRARDTIAFSLRQGAASRDVVSWFLASSLATLGWFRVIVQLLPVETGGLALRV